MGRGQQKHRPGPESRKKVREIKLVVGESSSIIIWQRDLKRKATIFSHLRLPPEPVGEEDILLSLHLGSSRTRKFFLSQMNPFLTAVGKCVCATESL